MTLWTAGFLAGLVVVLVVAVLLIGILYQAHRILKLAKTASAVVAEIDENTRAVWALSDTNEVADQLLGGAQAIDQNAAAIVAAVSHESTPQTAA